VVAFAVRDGEETLAFVPDVEGPVEPEPVTFLRQVRPTIAVVGGPPTYLSWELEKTLKHLAEIIALKPHTLVLAHHLLRDAQWREKMSSVFELAERHGVVVTTYAGLAGRPEELLEARRRELYEKEPAEPKPQLEEEED
jgi:predicted metallo-beta-lactamase superfamily hydrolase